jgi:hypothetical protein
MHGRNFKEIFRLRSWSRCPRGHLIYACILLAAMLSQRIQAAEPATNSFPTPAEIFQGRTFADKSERDVFFLKAIHDRYNSQWPALLEANITVQDYLQSPAKLLQFIDELGLAMRDRDDPAAIKNLASVTSDRKFFTNINAYHPEILRAAAQALIQLGPNGRKALAASFSQTHYHEDSESLEVLAKTISETRPPDRDFVTALAAVAFDFNTTNGGIYPRCTAEMVKNLLALPEGMIAVGTHLNTNEIFADPVRFQSVIDGIAAARATELVPNLKTIDSSVAAQLLTLKHYPGDYRDALEDLNDRIKKVPGVLSATKPAAK